MPLKLSVSKGERFIVNGVAIRNAGDSAELVFENQAQILRQKDILTTETATTPAARAYLALQCAYLFPDKSEHYLSHFQEFLDDFLEAAPSARTIADEIMENVRADKLYQGLKACGRLISHENEALSHVV
jgi:flagellar biosynthesis repressor protein FlbT